MANTEVSLWKTSRWSKTDGTNSRTSSTATIITLQSNDRTITVGDP